MSTILSPLPSLSQSEPILRTRSMGAKFFLIVLLALGMSLSGFFVEDMTTERADHHGVLAASADAPTLEQQPRTMGGIRLADSYRSTRRSLHYIPLFLGLVFLTYFLFEVMSGRSLHPAQYALVGVAQIIFYLLLLSLAEHMGFDVSFGIAGAATVGLFTANTEWVFESRRLAVRALAVFTGLYSFIYVLLRVEAYALLVGAVASFVAIAAAMYVTRTVDWYGQGAAAGGLATEGPLAGAASGGAAGVGGARESWLR